MKAKGTQVTVTPHTDVKPDEQTPKGTLAILLIYAGMIVSLWGAMYITMLMRG